MYSIYKVGQRRIAFLEMGKDKVNGTCGVPVAFSACQSHCASLHLGSDSKLQNWRMRNTEETIAIPGQAAPGHTQMACSRFSSLG